jgi:hypothetical protein
MFFPVIIPTAPMPMPQSSVRHANATIWVVNGVCELMMRSCGFWVRRLTAAGAQDVRRAVGRTKKPRSGANWSGEWGAPLGWGAI